MRRLETSVLQVVERNPADVYFVACSGGVDSTVLAHLCNHLNLPIELVHVNYQLRGADSDADETAVKSIADSFQVRFNCKRVSLLQELAHGGNLQQLARTHRYAYFDELLAENPNAYVLLAHHQEDQTETFFMNVFRGAGIMGLAAMPEKRDRFLRPLLSFSKNELINFAKKNAISWREDTSNATSKYTRNKWRNDVLPGLRQHIPELDTSIAILTQQFQYNQGLLEEAIKVLVAEINSKQQLSVQRYSELNSFDRIELFRQLKLPFGMIETLDSLHKKGSKLSLPFRESSSFTSIVYDGDHFSFLDDLEIEPPIIQVETCNALPTLFSKNELYLDVDKIIGELHVRPVNTGDRIHPIGMNGSRLVSDVISDAKLSSLEKQKLFVLCDENRVLWVPNLSVSRKAIASKHSKQIQKITLLFK